MDEMTTWELIHAERAAMADLLESLRPSQWQLASLCNGWSVQTAAGHILAGAEQTGPGFVSGMVRSGFRFNTMVDRDARRTGALATDKIIERLRARTTTTNRPPAPVLTMLGEIVVHGADIRRPLGIDNEADADAVIACLDMYAVANFPIGAKDRVKALRLEATDIDWSIGTGPVVSGPGTSLLLAVTGRPAGLDGLDGDGLEVLRSRMR